MPATLPHVLLFTDDRLHVFRHGVSNSPRNSQQAIPLYFSVSNDRIDYGAACEQRYLAGLSSIEGRFLERVGDATQLVTVGGHPHQLNILLSETLRSVHSQLADDLTSTLDTVILWGWGISPTARAALLTRLAQQSFHTTVTFDMAEALVRGLAKRGELQAPTLVIDQAFGHLYAAVSGGDPKRQHLAVAHPLHGHGMGEDGGIAALLIDRAAQALTRYLSPEQRHREVTAAYRLAQSAADSFRQGVREWSGRVSLLTGDAATIRLHRDEYTTIAHTHRSERNQYLCGLISEHAPRSALILQQALWMDDLVRLLEGSIGAGRVMPALDHGIDAMLDGVADIIRTVPDAHRIHASSANRQRITSERSAPRSTMVISAGDTLEGRVESIGRRSATIVLGDDRTELVLPLDSLLPEQLPPIRYGATVRITAVMRGSDGRWRVRLADSD